MFLLSEKNMGVSKIRSEKLRQRDKTPVDHRKPAVHLGGVCKDINLEGEIK